MLWREYHAALNTCLRKTWEHSCKVEHKLRCRVCDDCKIAVVALCYLLVELYFNAMLVVLVHSFICFSLCITARKGTKISGIDKIAAQLYRLQHNMGDILVVNLLNFMNECRGIFTKKLYLCGVVWAYRK